MIVTSLPEWLDLPEVACPVVQNEGRKGSIYTVHKVGFLPVSPSDCKDTDIAGAHFEAGKYLLPTAEVEFGRRKQLCRLPLQLSDWAIDSVAMAYQMGKSPFPMRVEFGILRGRYYAEML